jgi:hypothetical protein
MRGGGVDIESSSLSVACTWKGTTHGDMDKVVSRGKGSSTDLNRTQRRRDPEEIQ